MNNLCQDIIQDKKKLEKNNLLYVEKTFKII